MSFIIYTHDGMKEVIWFKDIQALLNSMQSNPKNIYHRN
jgi:hypothetical protein